jgi:tight adherence protein B
LPASESCAWACSTAARRLSPPRTLVATVQSGATLLHERAAVRAEALAHAAQARLSARVLTAVPVVFAAWNLTTSTTFRRAVCTPAGAVAAVAGAALSAVGWWWMQRVVQRVSR